MVHASHILTNNQSTLPLGPFFLSERAFSAILSQTHRDALRQISEEEMRALTMEMQQENSEALTVLQNNGVQLNNVSPSDLDSFKELVKQTIEELIEGPMPPELHYRVHRVYWLNIGKNSAKSSMNFRRLKKGIARLEGWFIVFLFCTTFFGTRANSLTQRF